MAKHVYVHIPFCLGKCGYCSFYSIPCSRENSLINSYYDACLKEVSYWASRSIQDVNPDSEATVYFGGGTPSLAPASLNVGLLRSIVDKFDIPEDAEKTIEVNPATCDYDYFCALKNGGFNRVSIGIQSLHDDTLKLLGRRHNSSEAVAAVEAAFNAGFTNVSGDLIIGIPGQTYEDVICDTDRLIDLGIRHISMYSLSIEEGTPFYEKYGDKLYEFASEDLERKMYHGLRGHLKERGIIPYEISNCGAPGFHSRHNMSYWDGLEYYAIGAGSHGYLEGVRFAHEDDAEAYILDMKTVPEEKMTFESKMHEYAMLRLRTSEGVDSSVFRERFGCDFETVFEEAIKENTEKGLLEGCDGKFRLTAKGLDFANMVFADFL